MRVAAAHLAGTHDFSAFRAAECQAKSPVKALTRIDVGMQGSLIRFDFSADAFLHHMLRNIVGSIVYVGAGKHPPAWIGELLVARDRTRAAPTFAPDGLYLAGADYPSRVVAQSTSSGERQVLVENAIEPHYLPTGHLAYVSRGVLFAVAFDARRVKATGGPVPLVQGIRSGGGTALIELKASRPRSLRAVCGYRGYFLRSET